MTVFGESVALPIPKIVVESITKKISKDGENPQDKYIEEAETSGKPSGGGDNGSFDKHAQENKRIAVGSNPSNEFYKG